MGRLPLVTVCIPTFNRPDMLRQSLQSVVWQSYPHLEVVVSDNASATDTEGVVAAFKDDRVRVDRLDVNVGLHANLSRCLRLGSGDYRVVLPDDDLMLPGNLERKVAMFGEHPRVGLVHSAFRYLDATGLPYGPVMRWTGYAEDTVVPGPAFVAESLSKGGIVCVSSVMMRSDLVADEAFVPDDGAYCDLALWLRIASRSDVGFLAEPLSGYRVHPSSASAGFQTQKQVRNRVVLTSHHADALKLAHGRYVAHADLDADTRRGYGRLLRTSDRRIRLAIRIQRHVPRIVLKGAKRVFGWEKGGRLYRALSLHAYSAYSPQPVSEGDRTEVAGADGMGRQRS